LSVSLFQIQNEEKGRKIWQHKESWPLINNDVMAFDPNVVSRSNMSSLKQRAHEKERISPVLLVAVWY
jgi:hypothetical protein